MEPRVAVAVSVAPISRTVEAEAVEPVVMPADVSVAAVQE
jgi:hypothetical protein